MAHDGSEGLSPDGWLPDRISVGVLARVFTPELVDAAVDAAGAREQRRRLLPARLVMYFVLALWLFRGRNCGYGQVMTKLADGLYHQRRAGDLLAGQELDPGGWVDAGGGRRWKPPNISSLSRGRGKLGPAPVRFLFEQVAGPIGEEGTPGVFCCGLRVVSIDGSTSDVPDEAPNDEHFGRPSNQARDGAFPQVRWLAAAESGTGSLLGASMGPYRDCEQALARDLLETGMLRAGDAGAGRPQVPVLGAGPGVPGHRGAHPVARLGVLHPQAGEGPGRRHLSGGTGAAPQEATARR